MADTGSRFGEALRFERERRGVSLESLCAETKVNPRHIEALEHGEYKVLPGGVFRRGIVRAYLTCVGLDEREWMPRFQASYAEHAGVLGGAAEAEDWTTFAENVKKNRSRPKPKLALRWLGVLALFLCVLCGAWAVWHFLLRSRLQP